MRSAKCICYTPRYTERVTIQQNSADDGDPAENFTGTPFKSNVACEIDSTSGDETYRGRQLEAHTDYVVKMPYFAGVLPTMRLLVTSGIWKDAILNIDHVNKKRLEGGFVVQWLYCTELVPV